MKIHRLVTGRRSDGKSTVLTAGAVERAHDFKNIPGMGVAQVWSTPPAATLGKTVVDTVAGAPTVLPAAGGAQFMIVRFPPDVVMQSGSFDAMAAGRENLEHSPGLAERFEVEHPGMHTTDTIDYGIVLEGEIWLELDDGSVNHLRTHDVVIQNGTRHAWRNRGTAPATMAFFMIGAKRVE